MGTYEKHGAYATVAQSTQPAGRERVHELLEEIGVASRKVQTAWSPNHILIGVDAETDEEVFWNPDPSHGTVNPHMLILGESGFGKTYAICCLLAELAQSNIPSIVFDYGQGFATGASPRHFIDYAKPIEIKASHEGVAINPLQLFPSDIHGPVNVAQRVADTFQRVYAQIGVQQHTILRQAVLDVMSDEGTLSPRIEKLGPFPTSIRCLAAQAAYVCGEPKSSTASHSVVCRFACLDDVCL
jgi:DNA phosphorothioation-dependent restriction protein DptH